MNDKEFIEKAKILVSDYTNRSKNEDITHMIFPESVYIVWECKTLQNLKALLGTHAHDGMYFEVTYNGDKNEFYFDAYKKLENISYDGTRLEKIEKDRVPWTPSQTDLLAHD